MCLYKRCSPQCIALVLYAFIRVDSSQFLCLRNCVYAASPAPLSPALASSRTERPALRLTATRVSYAWTAPPSAATRTTWDPRPRRGSWVTSTWWSWTRASLTSIRSSWTSRRGRSDWSSPGYSTPGWTRRRTNITPSPRTSPRRTRTPSSTCCPPLRWRLLRTSSRLTQAYQGKGP